MNLSCPIPHSDQERITLSHGGGGRLSQKLIEEIFYPEFQNEYLMAAHDGALLPKANFPLALTTDSHVVTPLFFPGGDIGTLSVFGCVNDLAMCGARPLYLSASFILEEGLAISDLKRVVKSMGAAAKKIPITIVTGDTKVVERGRCEGMYVTTTGVGEVLSEGRIAPDQVQSGDDLIVSGDLGRHGFSVLAQRQGFGFESPLESDCAPLWEPVRALIEGGIALRCLRDLTRGGLAAALCEIASAAHKEMEFDLSKIRIDEVVRGMSETLGIDPIHVANEGRFLIVLDQKESVRALEILRHFEVSSQASLIGRVGGRDEKGRVWMRGLFGQKSQLILPSGDPLPRIC